MTDPGNLPEGPMSTAADAGVVLPVGDRHAVVITSSDELDLTRVGSTDATVSTSALRTLATAAGLLAEGATMPARMAGRLVELDPEAVRLLHEARQVVEAGGWVQGNLRVNGQIAHVSRFRPATAVDVAGGLANIVSAAAAQAQLAAIHRDVLRTLGHVQQVSAFQHAELVGSIESDVQDVQRWISLMLDAGSSRRAIEAADRAGDRLRQHRAQCLILASKAVDSLEAAAAGRTPTKVLKGLKDSPAEKAAQYLHLAAAAHVAAVEAESLGVAELISADDASARAHAASLIERARREQARVSDVGHRAQVAQRAIAGTFGSSSDHFKRALKKVVLPGGAAAGAAGVAAGVAGGTAVRVAAASAIGAAAGPVALVATAGGAGVMARRHVQAEHELSHLLEELREAGIETETRLSRTNTLLNLIGDAAGLEPESSSRVPRADSRRPDPEMTERALVALLHLKDWADLPRVRSECGMPADVLRAALESAAEDGRVVKRPSPSRPHKNVEAVVQYRLTSRS